ncbi:hypothetical protein [Roseomonas sp. AR75]|jgi:hypothetical protein|uniref:hypothetical protein n=1 Tax=Roseomonas sp. AR75 TaxID=2562311 RepID=UPI0010BF70DE|nr:hypothetical protein [Roseomonas sp. AR75]
MDDKDRIDEPRGTEDALRPERPGGERKGPGETDQRPDPANAIPERRSDREAGRTTRRDLSPA